MHATTLLALAGALSLCQEETSERAAAPIRFETRRLSDEFLAEGASFADLDGDGHADVVSGPYWYAGPDFERRHRIYEQQPFDPKGYSNAFFVWPHDLSGDGALDLLAVGFPGAEAYWYENPGRGVGEWRRHLVHPAVDNESPAYVDLDGDGEPELVFHTGGVLGWAQPDPEDARAPWTFHPVSEDTGRGRFTHGLGVGDLDGDGRPDLLLKDEWRRQPESLAGDPVWERHPWPFAPGQGGAQMLVYDVDGDGDADVVTSLEAHGFGLVWHEQRRGADGAITFVAHTIMGREPAESAGGVVFAEPHALALCDVDGDGLLDVVTGKRWWSHGAAGDPMPGTPAVVYWFQARRDGEGGASFVPHLVHDDSGVGVQVVAGDVDGDGRADVVTGNKKGTFVHLQRAGAAGAGEDAERAPREPLPDEDGLPGGFLPRDAAGAPVDLDLERGNLDGWALEGDAFEGQPIRGDTVAPRRGDMTSGHSGEYWIGGYELHGDARTGTLTSPDFVVSHPFASFLVAGGRQRETRVELLGADGRALFSASGIEDERLRPVAIDLRAHQGELVRLRLVDEHTGHWGHVNFDRFRFHAQEPVFAPERPALAPLDLRVHAGLPAQEAAAAMELPPGFHVEVVAAEPDVHQPIAFCIDERGRLWIAEAYAYPKKRAPGEGEDRILILEDADGDGRFETRKLFAEGLNLVSGLEVGFGGVFVGAAPELLFLPDRDRDDVPDGPAEVLLDGWGYQDTHETLNAFLWGPDGWLYGCHGVFTHSRVGAPGTPDELRTPINAGIWRYHPTRRDFEVFAWGTSNPWGVDFDAHGQAFATACVIPHLFHVIQGARYERQAGEHFHPHVYRDIPTIADHRHYLGDTPHGGNGRSDAAGGGHAHCGLMVYLGGAFPAEYQGALFFNNIHGNRVNMDLAERHGSGFVGRHGADFLLANDRWFRGINLKYGPRGEVYLIDWYDPQACHHTNVDIWNRTNGRVYRVSYGEREAGRVDLAALGSDQLVALATRGNEWHARTARRLLQERGGTRDTRWRLASPWQDLRGPMPASERLRRLWTLHVTGNLDHALLLELLGDAEEYVRAWCVQLACEQRAPSRALLEAFAALAVRDPSPVVRLYLASALQRLRPGDRWEIVEALARRGEDAGDPNVPYLLWYGAEPLVELDVERALRLAEDARIPMLREHLWRRAASEERLHPALLQALARTRNEADRLAILDQMLVALRARRGVALPAGWPELRAELARSRDERVRDRALSLAAVFGDAGVQDELRARLADAGEARERRELALDALLRARQPETAAVLQALLAEEGPLRGAALRALAGFDDAGTPRALLEAWEGLGEGERADAVTTFAARASHGRALLAAVAEGQVPRAALTAVTLRQLRSLGDAEVDALLASTWGLVRETPEERAAAIEQWKERLTPEALAAADRSLGRDVFARTCMRCHLLYGEGGDIGPDITGSNRADLDYLLENVLDPNALIPAEYQVTIVRTHDGRLVHGILRGESESALELATENEQLVLAKDEVAERVLSSVSMMPEGQLDTLSEEEAIALFAYLAGDAQVPRRMTAANQAPLFDGESLAGWRGDPDLWSVEDGEIVGRSSAPLERNEWLKSDWELGDFRLTLEVKLTPPGANSGIQLRSRVLEDGEVAGYQADVGAGWWGKLYEEHGRGLLWSEPGDAHVRPGDWNRYEILALGDRIRTWINGQPCVDLKDPDGTRRGILALQMHSGPPLEVRFRNLRLELEPGPEPAASGSH